MIDVDLSRIAVIAGDGCARAKEMGVGGCSCCRVVRSAQPAGGENFGDG